jgi:hypothetical protein
VIEPIFKAKILEMPTGQVLLAAHLDPVWKFLVQAESELSNRAATRLCGSGERRYQYFEFVYQHQFENRNLNTLPLVTASLSPSLETIDLVSIWSAQIGAPDNTEARNEAAGRLDADSQNFAEEWLKSG